MRKQFIILILSLLILNGCVFSGQQAVETITSFEECLKAGNPVMESYPRQCRAGSTAFTEDIGNELAKMDLIRLDSPRPNAEVVSPLKIIGQARGSWFFEASFPVVLEDQNGLAVARGYATATSDWMTENFVGFTAELTFSGQTGAKGRLILKKDNPSGLPAPTYIDYIEEPYIKAQVITKTEYVGAIMNLCIDKRGILQSQNYLTTNRVELTFEMPLAEIVFDFYDKLKSISKGYASFDYHPTVYKLSKLVKLDILLNSEQVIPQ